MKLSKNFTYEELVVSATAKKYSIVNNPGEPEKKNLEKLVREILQPVRDRFRRPIIVTSGYRSPLLNKAVKGSVTSQHLKGEAADIKCSDNKALFKLIKEMIQEGTITVGQLIDEYNYSWIHVSLPFTRKNQILHLP